MLGPYQPHPIGMPPAPSPTLPAGLPSKRELEPPSPLKVCLVHDKRPLSACIGGYLNPSPPWLYEIDEALPEKERLASSHSRIWIYHILAGAGKLTHYTNSILSVDNSLDELFLHRPKESLWLPRTQRIIERERIYLDVPTTTAKASANSAAVCLVRFMRQWTPQMLASQPLPMRVF